MKRAHIIPSALLTLSTVVAAAEGQAAPAATSTGGMFQVFFGLLVVLGLMAAAAWGLKRFGVAKTSSVTNVKIVGGVNLGSRERILVIEVADQWIVVGVTPGQINTLSTMPKQESATASETLPATKNFSTWLKQTIEKRNDKEV